MQRWSVKILVESNGFRALLLYTVGGQAGYILYLESQHMVYLLGIGNIIDSYVERLERKAPLSVSGLIVQ